MTTPTSPTVQTRFPFGDDATEAPPLADQPCIEPERLMPLEAASKAIFVRANGLQAYQKANGYAGSYAGKK